MSISFLISNVVLTIAIIKIKAIAKDFTKKKTFLGFIHQYLCLVPQDRKFCNTNTSEIIDQSCRWLPNFSALTAARAFGAIERYSANLMNQPWRKEFREIKVPKLHNLFS